MDLNIQEFNQNYINIKADSSFEPAGFFENGKPIDIRSYEKISVEDIIYDRKKCQCLLCMVKNRIVNDTKIATRITSKFQFNEKFESKKLGKQYSANLTNSINSCEKKSLFLVLIAMMEI